MAGMREAWSIVLMNSVNLAVACSVYYSFCGNAPAWTGGAVGGEPWKEALCLKWLHPVSASSHSAFTRWMIYGEAATNASSTAPPGGGGGGNRLWGRAPAPAPAPGASRFMQIDFPLDGKVCRAARPCSRPVTPAPGPQLTPCRCDPLQGQLPVAATDLVSPIFTLWLTLLLMYGANCLADYTAAATLNAAYTADLRRGEGWVWAQGWAAWQARARQPAAAPLTTCPPRRRLAPPELDRRERGVRRRRRRRSADHAADLARHGSEGGFSAAEDAGSVRDALASFASRSSFDTLLRTMSSVGHILGSPSTTMRRGASMLFRDDFGIGLATSWLHPNNQGG